MENQAVNFWDLLNAPKPIEWLMKTFAGVIANWFWIKWVLIAALCVALAVAIRKHNRKVDEQKRGE